MHERLLDYVESLPFDGSVLVLIAAMAPLIEARYAIVFAKALGIPFWQAYGMAVLGNVLIIIPVLLLLGPLSQWCRRWPRAGRFFEWMFRRARRREDLIQRYGIFGLTAFVAVPLPVTGAWTGSAMAFVFGIRFWPALLATVLGVLISAGLVGAGVYGGARLLAP